MRKGLSMKVVECLSSRDMRGANTKPKEDSERFFVTS